MLLWLHCSVHHCGTFHIQGRHGWVAYKLNNKEVLAQSKIEIIIEYNNVMKLCRRRSETKQSLTIHMLVTFFPSCRSPGALYIHDCSLQDMVPVFLIFSGVGSLFLIPWRYRNRDIGAITTKVLIVAILGFVFFLAFLISGKLFSTLCTY